MELHGEMSMHWDKKTLVVCIDGPLNIEAAIAFTKKLKDEIRETALDTWFNLVKYSPCALGGPDVVRAISNFNDWCFLNGCQGCAVLITCAPQRMLYRMNENNTEVFYNETDARKWLASLLHNWN